MKGDLTRETFRAQRHYWGVLRQQGRVDIDADWNEQVRIARHQDVTRTADLVGPSGGPTNGAGFGLTVDTAGSVRIGAGRYYVAGVLCENEAEVALAGQPDPPAGQPPAAAGLHLAYLDVWDRHVTALDDPAIREVALGGPDTATRARTVWQVRTRSLLAASAAFTAAVAALAAARAATPVDADAEAAALQELRQLATEASCAAPLAPVDGSLAPGTGTMAARTVIGTEAADLCRFDPGGGGYTRLENRLYRVEIHDAGDDVAATAATFKWSRDNGSIAVSVEEFRNTGGGATTTEVVVRRLGLDETQELKQDDWIEIVSDDLIARGEPGQLIRIAAQPDPADRILLLSAPADIKAPELHPQVRRWDLPVGGLARVTRTWQELEAGIEVRFGAGSFHTGDHWVIPARANTADVEWPPLPEYPGHEPPGPPESLPPRGIAHWRAPLAALVHDGTRVVASIDLRALFPAATELMVFAYAGGDGQEPVLPSGDIPGPLQVSVTNGTGPVAGVIVEFAVVDGTSALSAGAASGTVVTVATGADGLASVDWTVLPTVADHRVRARLLDDCATPTRAPVFFSARVNYQLHYLGGDGQEGMPGEPLQPLRVWVSDGRHPVDGANVRFTITAGTGSLSAHQPTGADGVTERTWTLDAATPIQQVTAELLDAAGAPIHDAALTFTANLSLASRVAYAPAAGCTDLSTATNVQDALDMLCRRQGGGSCTFVVTQDTDVERLFGEIQASDFVDGAICFADGTWPVREPLRLRGKGHVMIRGSGRGSLIVAERGESAIAFEGCASVTVRDVAVQARGATARDGLGGAITAVDCGPVTVEDVAVACASGPEPLVAGLHVRGGPIRSTGPVRVLHSDFEIGERQVGVLIVNARHTEIEGNTVLAGTFDPETRLADYVSNARYRAAARRELVEAENEPERSRARDRGREMVRIPLAESGETVAFSSSMTNAPVWRELIASRSPATRREVVAAAESIADEALRHEGAFEGRRVFREWYEEVERRWTPAGHRGIVVAGTRANEVRIVGNTVSGHLQGISVALSADDRNIYRSGVVLVSDNTIELPRWSLVARHAEGIFLGNCESAVIEDNGVAVSEGPDRIAIDADGVWAAGVFGPRLVISTNHFRGTVAGVRVEPKDTGPARKRWVATDNVATTGPLLIAPCQVMEDGNVPARGDPCPADRPV